MWTSRGISSGTLRICFYNERELAKELIRVFERELEKTFKRDQDGTPERKGIQRAELEEPCPVEA